MQFPAEKIEAVCHAIAAHSFSAQIAPLTTEAKIVQDADRLEALGAIGLARVFAVSGALGLALFDGEDPFAQHRPLDDKRYALDHFQTKLLKLPQTMQTARGKQLAQHNAQFLVEFMAKLGAELAGENEGIDHKVIDAFSPAGYSAAIFLIPICISFDTAEKRRYATYLILNRRFSFEF